VWVVTTQPRGFKPGPNFDPASLSPQDIRRMQSTPHGAYELNRVALQSLMEDRFVEVQ